MHMANPNPSPATRFGAEKGNPINLAGKTKEQRENEYKAAEIAAKLRARALSDMLELVESGESILEMIDANTLKLFKDSEDRAHGTPAGTTTLKGDEEAPLNFTGILLAPLEMIEVDETEH